MTTSDLIRKYFAGLNNAIIFFSLIFSISIGNFGSSLLPISNVIAASFVYRVLFSRRKK